MCSKEWFETISSLAHLAIKNFFSSLLIISLNYSCWNFFFDIVILLSLFSVLYIKFQQKKGKQMAIDYYSIHFNFVGKYEFCLIEINFFFNYRLLLIIFSSRIKSIKNEGGFQRTSLSNKFIRMKFHNFFLFIYRIFLKNVIFFLSLFFVI